MSEFELYTLMFSAILALGALYAIVDSRRKFREDSEKRAADYATLKVEHSMIEKRVDAIEAKQEIMSDMIARFETKLDQVVELMRDMKAYMASTNKLEATLEQHMREHP